MHRFLIDMCVASKLLLESLRAAGHDVLVAADVDPRSSDAQLLSIAYTDERIVITADKDFGELVFVHGHPHGPLVRLVDMSVDEQVRAVEELLSQRGSEMHGPVIITISLGRVRLRRRNLPA